MPCPYGSKIFIMVKKGWKFSVVVGSKGAEKNPLDRIFRTNEVQFLDKASGDRRLKR